MIINVPARTATTAGAPVNSLLTPSGYVLVSVALLSGYFRPVSVTPSALSPALKTDIVLPCASLHCISLLDDGRGKDWIASCARNDGDDRLGKDWIASVCNALRTEFCDDGDDG